MVEADWKIRPYEAGDEDAINQLHNRIFGANRSLEEWRWKFFENPDQSADYNPISVLLKDGAIVGNYCSLPIGYSCKGSTQRVDIPIDTVIDRSARVGIRLMRRLIIGHRARWKCFGIGQPNERHYKVGKSLFEYRDLVWMEQLVKPLSAKGYIQSKLPSTPRPLLRAAHHLSGILYRISPAWSSKYTVERVSVFDTRIDELWERIRHRWEITLIRSSKHLNWRYSRLRPSIHCALLGDTVVGYIVATIESDAGSTHGKILDFVYEDRTAGTLLLSSSLRSLRSEGAVYAICGVLPGDPVRDLLVAEGFMEKPDLKPIPVVWANSNDEVDLDYMIDASHWSLFYGDFHGI